MLGLRQCQSGSQRSVPQHVNVAAKQDGDLRIGAWWPADESLSVPVATARLRRATRRLAWLLINCATLYTAFRTEDKLLSVLPMESLQLGQTVALGATLAAHALTLVAWLAARYFVMVATATAGSSGGRVPLAPYPIPFVGFAKEFGESLVGLLREQSSAYGDIFTITVMGNKMTFVTDHAFFREMMRNKKLNFELIAHGVSTKAFSVTMEAATAIPPSAFHAIYKKGMQTPDHLDIMSRSVQQALHEEICAKLFPQGLGSTSTVDLFDAVSKVAFFATMKSIYGGAEQGFATAAAHQAFLDFDKNFPYLVGGAPMWAFKDSEAGFKKLRALFMDESVYSDTASYIISEREKLYARNNFTDDNRAGFQVALLWGTVSNTMPTTFWCLYFLLGDPAAMKAVRDEVDALTAGLEPSSSQLDGTAPAPPAPAPALQPCSCGAASNPFGTPVSSG